MLEGDLSDFTLPEILKLLAFTSKTGRLHLRHDDTLGRVEVRDGRVRAASADAAHLPLARRLVGRGLLDTDTLQALIGGRGQLPTDLELAQALLDDADADDAVDVDAAAVAEAVRAQSVDAVFDLLRWTEGRFRFAVEDVPSAGPLAVDHDLDDLLDQARQRLERWEEIHERTGPGDASVSVTSPPDTSVELDADAWQLIGLADGRRTIDELAGLTGRGQFDTRSTLVALANRGLVAFGTAEHDGALERLLRAQTTLGELEQRLGGTPAVAGQSHDVDTAAATDIAVARTPHDGAAQEADTLVAEFDLDAMADADEDVGVDVDATHADADTGDADAAALADQAGDAGRRDADDTAQAGDVVAATVVRRPRLRTDPSVDSGLVDRLIDGVRNLA